MKNELKSCPFCGGEAEIICEIEEDGTGLSVWCECLDCKTGQSKSYIEREVYGMSGELVCEKIKEAATMWNKREGSKQ